MNAAVLQFPTQSPIELARREVRYRLRGLLTHFEVSVAEDECAAFIYRGMSTRSAIERAIRNAMRPKPEPPSAA
jgi:hypothetical protein